MWLRLNGWNSIQMKLGLSLLWRRHMIVASCEPGDELREAPPRTGLRV